MAALGWRITFFIGWWKSSLHFLDLNPFGRLVLRVYADALLLRVLQDDGVADRETVARQTIEVPLLDFDLVSEDSVEVEVV